MPANEIVWRAKVWEHTTRLAERNFLRRLRQSSLSARLAAAVRDRVPLGHASPVYRPCHPAVWSSPCCVCVCVGVYKGEGLWSFSWSSPRNFVSSLVGRSLSGLKISLARVKRNTTFSRILKQPHGPCSVHRDSTHHSLLPFLE